MLSVGLLITLGWFGVQTAVRRHRDTARLQVVAMAEDAALTEEEQVRLRLLAIGQTLRLLQRAWQGAPTRFKLDDWREDLPVFADAVLQVSLTDEHGVIRASTQPRLIGGRAGEPVRRATGCGGMLIGPLVAGWGNSPGGIDLTCQLIQPDGSLAGLLVASYEPYPRATADGRFDVGPHGLVALVTLSSGAVDPLIDPAEIDPVDMAPDTRQAAGGDAARDGRAAASGDAARDGRNAADSEIAYPGKLAPAATIAGSRLLAAMTTASRGVWTGISPFDGVDRMHAFRRVAGRELDVVVAPDSAAAMRGAQAWDRWAQASGAALSILVVLLGALMLRAAHAAGAAQRRENELARDRASLAETTRQLQATLAGMTDGIMMLDADQRLLAWNDKFPAFTGVPAPLLRIGLPMAEMLYAQAAAGEFGPVDPDAEVNRRLALLHNSLGSGTTERVRPNGQVLELRRNPLPGGGFVTLYTDVTDRRAAEDRMREAQKMAALGRLTAGVAHDFNNVLASIIGSAELLERQLRDDPGQARRLAVILHGAQRGANLVRQLLAFSRKQPLAPVAVDANAIVRGMSELLASTLGGAVRVGTRLGARWPALVDPVQIEHVILNLAINARDAMPDGGTLTIATADVTLDRRLDAVGLAPGAYVSVSVSDTGTGMTPEVLRNALEPFFTTKPPGRGSGLGLSQVYGVASQSGGGVRIDSALNQGSTVTVFLPRAEAEAADCGDAARGSRHEPPCGQGTVLLVEHEAHVRETLAGMLAALGFSTLLAEDGAAALRVMEAGDGFDLLLTDLVMPGVDGRQLAAALRARRPAVPVVLITGCDDDSLVGGERWVLSKPFVTSQLAETLRAALWQAGVPASREAVS
jgi:signal transduction histidine kinase/CheY-like chemotaxis protein